MERQARQGAGVLIPQVIHRIWLGGREPDWFDGFAESWRRPGWTLVQWTEENLGELFPFGNLRNQTVYDRAERLCPHHVGQLRSDILRYEILWRFGGVYVDADFECLRPIDELIAGADCFAAWEIQDSWIANGLMGAVAGYPFIGRLIDGIPASVRRYRGSKPNRMTGPQYVTRTWRRHGQGVRVLPQRLVYPYGWREIADCGPGDDWPLDAVAVHHWANKRREHDLLPA